MNKKIQPSAALSGAAITAYAAWSARDILTAWVHSPYDRCDSLVFVMWLAPLCYLWMAYPVVAREVLKRSSCAAFAAALGLSFLGVIVDMSALKYLGLAVALAGFLPMQPVTLLWLAAAAAWMPAAGWTMSAHGVPLVCAMRLAVGLGALSLTSSFLHDEPVR
jgi:hypothetical protein